MERETVHLESIVCVRKNFPRRRGDFGTNRDLWGSPLGDSRVSYYPKTVTYLLEITHYLNEDMPISRGALRKENYPGFIQPCALNAAHMADGGGLEQREMAVTKVAGRTL